MTSNFDGDYSRASYEELQKITMILKKTLEPVEPKDWARADKQTAYEIELNRRSLAQVNYEWVRSPEYARRIAKKAQEQADREEKLIKNIVGDEPW